MKKRSLQKSLEVVVVYKGSWDCLWGAPSEVHSDAISHVLYWNYCQKQNAAGLEGPWPWQRCRLQSPHVLAGPNGTLCSASGEHIRPGRVTLSTGLEPFSKAELEHTHIWTSSGIFIAL